MFSLIKSNLIQNKLSRGGLNEGGQHRRHQETALIHIYTDWHVLCDKWMLAVDEGRVGRDLVFNKLLVETLLVVEKGLLSVGNFAPAERVKIDVRSGAERGDSGCWLRIGDLIGVFEVLNAQLLVGVGCILCKNVGVWRLNRLKVPTSSLLIEMSDIL